VTAQRAPVRSIVLLVVATLALIGSIAAPRHGVPSVLVVLVATAAGGGFAFLEQRQPRLGIFKIAADSRGLHAHQIAKCIVARVRRQIAIRISRRRHFLRRQIHVPARQMSPGIAQ